MKRGEAKGGAMLDPKNPLTPRLKNYAARVLKALPTPQDTAFHLELFWHHNEPIFCEIASRAPAAWIRDFWLKGTGVDLQREHIRAQAFLPPTTTFNQTPDCYTGGLVFPSREGVIRQLPASCTIEGVTFTFYVEEGDALPPSQGILCPIASCVLKTKSWESLLQLMQQTITWFHNALVIRG
jgi:hypothetical protein